MILGLSATWNALAIANQKMSCFTQYLLH